MLHKNLATTNVQLYATKEFYNIGRKDASGSLTSTTVSLVNYFPAAQSWRDVIIVCMETQSAKLNQKVI